MTPEMWGRLNPFRGKAIAEGIPADEVEHWISTARPCATLSRKGDGPIVGRFGGPLLLPADAPDPEHPYVATIDLAALPADMTDLPLPPDGQLVFFAFPESEGCESRGSVVYLPVGTPVVERDKLAWDPFEWPENEAMLAEFPQGPLRATANVSLPCHHIFEQQGEPRFVSLPGHPHSEELAEIWQSTRADIAPEGPLQIGGYADEEAIETDPVDTAVRNAVDAVAAGSWAGPVSADVSDWVLLADWVVGLDVQGWESSTVHWVIQREDLAARRFDRAFTSVFWNP